MSSYVESAFQRVFAVRPSAYSYLVLWLGIATGWIAASIGFYYIYLHADLLPHQIPRLLIVFVSLLILVTVSQRLSLRSALHRMALLGTTHNLDDWNEGAKEDLRTVLSFPGRFAISGLVYAEIVIVLFLLASFLYFFEIAPGRFQVAIIIGGQIATIAFVLISYSMVEVALSPLRKRFPPVDQPALVARVPRFIGYKSRVFMSMMALVVMSGALVGSLVHREMSALFPFATDLDVPSLVGQLIIIGLVTLAFGTVLAVSATSIASRLIEDCMSTLTRLAAGDLSARATVASGGDLGFLNANVNLMAKRMEETITELRRSRHALNEAEQRRSELVAQLSHDLRSPTSAIMASAFLGEREALEASQPSLVSHFRLIMRNGKRVTDLASNILDLEKMEHSELELEPRKVNVKKLIEELLESSAPLLGGRKVALRADISDEVRDIVTDEDKLTRILDNLLSNAIRVTKEGEITIGAKALSANRVAISIADTGPGIQPDIVNRILEPSAKHLSPRGSGLGLVISLGFARLLGGTLTVDTETAKGTTFVLNIPLTPPTTEQTPNV